MLIKSIIFDNYKYSNIPSIVLESGDIIPSSFFIERGMGRFKQKRGYDAIPDMVMVKSIGASLAAGEIYGIKGNVLSLSTEFDIDGYAFSVECIYSCEHLSECLAQAVGKGGDGNMETGNKIVN